jgi:hypothetical protein
MEHDETLERLVFRATNFEHGKAVNTLIRKDPFRCNVQPLNGRELLLVPEHQRFSEQYWAYVPISVNGKMFEKPGDVVLRGEVHYQVQEVEYWGSYQRVRLMRVDIGPYKTP